MNLLWEKERAYTYMYIHQGVMDFLYCTLPLFSLLFPSTIFSHLFSSLFSCTHLFCCHSLSSILLSYLLYSAFLVSFLISILLFSHLISSILFSLLISPTSWSSPSKFPLRPLSAHVHVHVYAHSLSLSHSIFPMRDRKVLSHHNNSTVHAWHWICPTD